MSIKSQLTANHVPFISMRRTLLSLAEAEGIPFEAVADFLFQRADSMPAPIRHDRLTLQQSPVDREHAAVMLDSVVFFCAIGVIHGYDAVPSEQLERDDDGQIVLPYVGEFEEVGWSLDELADWLKQNGVNPAPLRRIGKEKNTDSLVTTAPPDSLPAPLPQAQPKKANGTAKKFASCDDNELMSIADVMEITGQSRATINRRFDDGTLEKIKAGPRSVRVKVGDVRKMLTEQQPAKAETTG